MKHLTNEDRERLLAWLKDSAKDMAADLRDAGWTEDAGGLWSKGNHRRQHLYAAHTLETGRET